MLNTSFYNKKGCAVTLKFKNSFLGKSIEIKIGISESAFLYEKDIALSEMNDLDDEVKMEDANVSSSYRLIGNKYEVSSAFDSSNWSSLVN